MAIAGYLWMAGAFYLIWFGHSAPQFAQIDFWIYFRARGSFLLASLVAPLLGGLIASRRPKNIYGWVWLIQANAFSILNFTQVYATHGLEIAPSTLPLAELALAGSVFSWGLSIATISAVLLLFPTGHLPSRRWRPLAGIFLATALATMALSWARPGQSAFLKIENPLGVPGFIGELAHGITLVGGVVLFTAIPLSTLPLVLRYRQANDLERQQMKWIAYGAALFMGIMFSDFIIELPGVWESFKEALAFNILPVTIGVAILRHRLWEIDVLIRKTLAYSLLTALLALVYLGSVAVLQNVVTASGGRDSALINVLSTLAIAALFSPLRRRVQAAVDRRFYRRKYDAERALGGFSTAARSEVDLDLLSARLVGVVDETLQPRQVSLWLRPAQRQLARVERQPLFPRTPPE